MVGPVSEGESVRGFGIDIPAGQAVQASFANPPREPRRKQGGPDEEGDGSVEDLEIVCHGDSSNA